MHLAALVLLLAAPAADSATSPNAVDIHGVQITAPDGWVKSLDGTTVVFDAPEKQASLRIDTFEKEKLTDAQDCLDQVIKNLAASEKVSADAYAQGVIDGQPSASEVTFTDDRKHHQKRVVGCNGKNYFLIDWVELTHAGPKYEKAFTKLLTSIKYDADAAKGGK